MRRGIQLFGAAVLSAAVVGLSGLAPASAAAPSTTKSCTGELAAGSYRAVVVPAGAVCFSAGPVTIKGGLTVQPGATFVLGDEEHPGHTGTITGGVHATRAMSVQIHFTTIKGGVDIQGGSGAFGGPFGVTWNTIEDSKIDGGASIVGYNGFWQGFIRNVVNGAVRLSHNVLQDPDGNEFVTNQIHGSMTCLGNSPAPQIGDSEGAINAVTGAKIGQCAKV
jgi:hypothetical protein